ncbi:unnamed protein product [Arctia plantaginis]|uniref:Peptidase M14 domain-containing protein n=1 Tax=Arctia plantaginis TaxID=874455 RepID=A0A8S1BCR3_ARCPL|nr:unnamed protein product [Arctia plantaginis]
MAVTCNKTLIDIFSDRNSVHNIKVRDKSDQDFLFNLLLELDLDVWNYGEPLRQNASVMVTPENRQKFLEAIDGRNLEHNVHIDDVAKYLEDVDNQHLQRNARDDEKKIFEKYPRHAEVDEYLEYIANQYPAIATIVNAGNSFEGRPMKYLKISTTNFADNTKPIYFMEAMLHAREWATTPVALYSIHRLVENVTTEDQDLLNNIDWIILPIANPDGYEYTHTDQRLWRKTRSINPTSDCIGVDGNRNFDANFNTVGVSQNPCSDVYPGWVAFSEVETRIVRDIMLEYLDRMEIFMDIHSFGSYILFPNGDGTLPPTAPQLHQVGCAMGAAIDTVKLPQAIYYRVANAGQLLYPTSGDSTDYGQIIGIPFPYTLELPNFGGGFIVPEELIEQTNMESWLGIAATARLARIYYRAKLNLNN